MTKKFIKLISIISLISILLILCSTGASAKASDSYLPAASYAFTNIHLGSSQTHRTSDVSATPLSDRDYSKLKLYVGGMPFGVKFLTEGVIIVGFNEAAPANPAKAAGLRRNDVIISVNGRKVFSAESLNEAVRQNGNKAMTIEYTRDGKVRSTVLTPANSKADGSYNLGIYVRDSGAGIGTVTFIDPKTCAFGGLGHGICDGGTGKLIPMQRGSVLDVRINGIVKGLSGSPGEVKGFFNSGKTGTLLSNTDCGVYGILAELPKEIQGEPMSLGLRHSVKEGKAYLCSMLDGTRVERYEIEISEIKRSSTDNKSFVVKVTDKRLIDKTGGIIQGMSGSPIIQDGKLIGAVTHVLINDPTTGYGIFIENMLNQMGDLAG